MGEICVRVPRWMPELIDVLVKGGLFKKRSEFVGFAIGLTLYGYRAVLEDTWGVKVLIGSPYSSSEREKGGWHFGLRGEVTYFCFQPVFC